MTDPREINGFGRGRMNGRERRLSAEGKLINRSPKLKQHRPGILTTPVVAAGIRLPCSCCALGSASSASRSEAEFAVGPALWSGQLEQK